MPRNRCLTALPFACLACARLVQAELPSGPCDYLVISDSLLSPQAQRLADFRGRVSPEIATYPCVALMEDIEAAFPPTGLRWTSLRDYLAARWEAHGDILKHVALLGSASLEDEAEENRVPAFRQPMRARIPTGVEPDLDTLVSDDVFSTFVDSVGWLYQEKPRFAVGRIPAATLAQAEAYLDKIEIHESVIANGPRAYTFGYASDDDHSPGSPNDLEPIYQLPEDHQALWDRLQSKPFVRRVLSIEFALESDTSKPAATDSLIGLFNSEPGRIYYVGHGSPVQLSSEKLFLLERDLSRLQTKRVQPLVVMLACETIPYASPGTDFGRTLLFHPHGAIAFIGMSIPAYPRPNLDFGLSFDSAAALGGTVGQAVVAAKRNGTRGEDVAGMNLLGDPALSLRIPQTDLRPSEASGLSRLVLENAGSAGDSAYFELVRIDSLPWNDVILPDNLYQRDRFYPRETVLTQGKALLQAGGRVEFFLPPVTDAERAAIKVMTWNEEGMRYGHFPLDSLGSLGLRPQARDRRRDELRMRVRREGVVLEKGGRLYGLDGKSLRGEIRRLP